MPFRRKRPQKLTQRVSEASTRAERLSTSELYDWAEQSQYVYGWCITEHRRTIEPVTAANMLEEAQLAAEVELVIARELQARTIR